MEPRRSDQNWIEPVTREQDYPGLFDLLDLDLPRLAAVRQAVEQGDMPAAEKAFAAFCRREVPRRFVERERPSALVRIGDCPEIDEDTDRDIADHMLNHEFYLPSEDRWHPLGTPIDWCANPTCGEQWTIEYTSAMNRHYWFLPMLRTFDRTGDVRYIREIVNQMVHWTRTWPLPEDIATWSNFRREGQSEAEFMKTFGWNSLQPADQCNTTWPAALLRVLPCPAVSDREICAIAWSLYQKALFLDGLPPRWEGNKGAREQAGLYKTAVMFAEFREAGDWRRRAIERQHRQLADSFYPDGMHRDLCVGYVCKMLSTYVDMLDMARHNGLMHEFPEDFLALTERKYEYQAYAMMPNGVIPGLSDSHDVKSLVTWGADLFPGRSDFGWFARGMDRTPVAFGLPEDGPPPSRTSVAFPYCGHYVMRSGYDRDARYLLFDGGPLGFGHCHFDKLTVILYAHGRKLLTEGSNYAYDNSRWRRYVISTRGHNTIRVDGLDQRDACRGQEKPFEVLDNVWVTGETADYVRSTYDAGYGEDRSVKVDHTRAIVFLRPDYWIILDSLVPRDGEVHAYESLWHLSAGSARVDEQSGSVVSTDEDAANLQLWPAWPSESDAWSVELVKGRTKEPVQGWAGDPWRPVPTAVYRRHTAGPAWMALVACPLPAGEASPVERVACSGGDADAPCVVVRFADGRRDELDCRCEAGVLSPRILRRHDSAGKVCAETRLEEQ